MKNELKIQHDDRPEDVIEKINDLLDYHGLKLIDDQREHDGFCVFHLLTWKQYANLE